MTEAFNQKELEDWRQGLDIPALREKLGEAAASERSENPNASTALAGLSSVYGHVASGDYVAARSFFRQLEEFLRDTTGWDEVQRLPLPNPLDEEPFSKWFWQANRALSNEASPAA
jgi:hypothetical protein